ALLKSLVEQTGLVPIYFEKHLGEETISAIPGFLETRQEGRELLTYATPELAIVYARFLSAECYEWALTTLVEDREENANHIGQVEEATSEDAIQLSRRRALISVGWTMPIIVGITLPHKALADDFSHNDLFHTDLFPHFDGVHSDLIHT